MLMPMALIAIGTAAVGFGIQRTSRAKKTPKTLNEAIAFAKKTGDIAPLEEVLSNTAAAQQVTAMNTAVTRLWEDWERETAIRLIREVAQAVPDELIVQFWLRKAMEVEPELAGMHFSETFLLAYYKPDVARRCGSGGCC